MKDTKINNSLDLFKIIMAIFVVAIHTEPLKKFENDLIINFYYAIVRNAVPFFFITAGYLLARKLDWPYNSLNNIEIIRKYLLKIIKMYLIWSAIYLPLAIYYYIQTNMSFDDCIKQYIVGFVFIGEHYNSWNLWYLLSTIYGLIFVLILIKFRIKPNKIALIGFIIIVISFGIDKLMIYSGDLPATAQLFRKLISETCVNGRIFRGFFFFPYGMLAAHKGLSSKISWVIFIIGFLVGYFTNGIIESLAFTICSIGLFHIILTMQMTYAYSFLIMRKMSIIVYLIHMYIWTIYYNIIYHKKTFGLDSFIVTVLVSLIIAYGSVYAQNLFLKYHTHNSVK